MLESTSQSTIQSYAWERAPDKLAKELIDLQVNLHFRGKGGENEYQRLNEEELKNTLYEIITDELGWKYKPSNEG